MDTLLLNPFPGRPLGPVGSCVTGSTVFVQKVCSPRAAGRGYNLLRGAWQHGSLDLLDQK